MIDSLNEYLRPAAATTSAALTLRESHQRVRELVQSSHADAVITLGGATTQLLQAAGLHIPLFAGAAALPVGAAGISGISTIVDPATQLSLLTRFAPTTRRVFVVHDPRDSWLIALARREASARGLLLSAQVAESLRAAAVAYLITVRAMIPRRDALWLPAEPELLPSDVVEAIVEQAWSSSALVYSSVLAQVAQGTLFATYPDARRIARRLATMVLTGAKGIALDDQPNTAVNVRTAKHLVSRLNMSLLPTFTLRFGER